MTYNLRDRNLMNNNGTNLGSSGSDNESYDSTYSDPDYVRHPRPRVASYNNGGPSMALNIEKRQPGRPPKTKVNGTEDRLGFMEVRRGKRKARNFSQLPVEHLFKRTVLAWLIRFGIVEENEVVLYVEEGSRNILAHGKIDGESIECTCCSRKMTVGEFEIHAGNYTGKPYQHIFLAASQISLLECQIKAWENREERHNRAFNNIQPVLEASDKSDDACIVCADGGDLICCDKCPSTFHSNCIFMEKLPGDIWLCPYCVCKYCGSGEGTLDKCNQCEKQYHCKCGGEKLDLNSPTSPFCGDSCKQIYEGLQSMLGVKNDLADGFSWTLLQRTEQLDDEYKKVVVNSKIAVAWMLMNDCFEPSIDRFSGVNVVRSIVYNNGSNLTRLNFSGFYTAILEKNDEIICAATIRIHGKRLAEMPFIGTLGKFRRQGMARLLENCIESALCALKIEKLVIPSLDQLADMWKQKYFFSAVEEERLARELSQYNMVMFPTLVVRLHKTLATLPDLNIPSETDEGLKDAI